MFQRVRLKGLTDFDANEYAWWWKEVLELDEVRNQNLLYMMDVALGHLKSGKGSQDVLALIGNTMVHPPARPYHLLRASAAVVIFSASLALILPPRQWLPPTLRPSALTPRRSSTSRDPSRSPTGQRIRTQRYSTTNSLLRSLPWPPNHGPHLMDPTHGHAPRQARLNRWATAGTLLLGLPHTTVSLTPLRANRANRGNVPCRAVGPSAVVGPSGQRRLTRRACAPSDRTRAQVNGFDEKELKDRTPIEASVLDLIAKIK